MMNNSIASIHVNRLAHESSPYLLQHAHNPVDWYPWGEEAFRRAREEHRPIFLSIGYSSCHWCHVMEKESFENEAIADLMNRHFVCIKVDREELPDVDEVYMSAVQMMTGRGGWPLSVFLTPDLEPFFGGTYFPPEDSYGLTGFRSVLEQIAAIWDKDRLAVLENATHLSRSIRESHAEMAMFSPELTAESLAEAARSLERSFDTRWGGFGKAPKFPAAATIAFLLRQHYRTGQRHLLDMATFTLDRMAAGGIRDHLGGGFHRYAVDDGWLVPHFEKMLYDNALLSFAYLEAYQVTGKDLYRRVAAQTLDYVLADMTDPSGGFHSAEDADSEGEEGKFYLWSHDEIMQLLGRDDGSLFCSYYGVTQEGNLEQRNILHQTKDDEAFALEHDLTESQLLDRIERMRGKLLAVRKQRVRPAKDDKIIAAWNGMMISSMAKGWQVLEDPRYLDAAETAGRFICERMTSHHHLGHAFEGGESRVPGYLDDYACVINGFVDLYEATFDISWHDAADCLALQMIDLFWDVEGHGFYFSALEHTSPIVRTKPFADGATPSGSAVAALALLRLYTLTCNEMYREKAMGVLRAAPPLVREAPRAAMGLLRALDYAVHPIREIAFAGDPDDADLRGLIRVAYSRFLPGKAMALVNPASPDSCILEKCIPFLKAKRLQHGRPAAYVCRNFTCKPPVSEPDVLAALLDSADEQVTVKQTI